MTSLARLRFGLMMLVFAGGASCEADVRTLDLLPGTTGGSAGASGASGSAGTAGSAGTSAGSAGVAGACNPPSCVRCTIPADCASTLTLLFCVDGRCVGCESSGDCVSNHQKAVCDDVTQACRPCKKTSECVLLPGTTCNPEGECE